LELKETVIGTENIYDGKILHLRVDTVRLPNGHESKREIVAHKGAVCVVPVQADGTILMVRQFRLAAGQALLEIPAGTLEPGEDPEACAARELEEETGYRATTLRPLFQIYPTPGYSTERIHAYLATGLTPGKAHLDAGENVELVAVPMAEADRMALSGEIQDAKTLCALLVALRSL
jgi:ADP-ribose pyrophosphatase